MKPQLIKIVDQKKDTLETDLDRRKTCQEEELSTAFCDRRL
jgi:hypothetical protein